MILSIIIPVYNEERTVIEVLEKIKKNSSNLFKYEIIVIDDGSTDQSKNLLEKNNHLYDKLILNEINKGKGFSIKKGLSNASGTHIIFQDAPKPIMAGRHPSSLFSDALFYHLYLLISDIAFVSFQILQTQSET